MDEILVSQEGYNQYFDEIEKLKRESKINAINGSKSYIDAVGDGWHDNFAFEDSVRESRKISARLEKMIKNSNKLKIVNDSTFFKDKSIIKLGEKLRIKVNYTNDDEETYDVLLTGKYLPSDNENITEITLNSPIGKAIYLKKVGQQIVTKINQNDVKILIIKKL